MHAQGTRRELTAPHPLFPPHPTGGRGATTAAEGAHKRERLCSAPRVNQAERNVAFAIRRLLAPIEGHDAVYGQFGPGAADEALAAVAGALGGGASAGGGAGGAGGGSRRALSPRQEEAVRRAAAGRLLLLTGGPGTGKTFTVGRIVAAWRAQGKRV
eukprot:4638596-Prymnesium_polylepis.1